MMEWELDQTGKDNAEKIKHFSDQDRRLEITRVVIISVVIKSIH